MNDGFGLNDGADVVDRSSGERIPPPRCRPYWHGGVERPDIDLGNGRELPQPGDVNAAEQMVRIGRRHGQMRGFRLAPLA